MDAVAERDLARAGQKMILPPTIYSSPKFYFEAFQNAMNNVRMLGIPDFFITFTTNLNCPEINEALNPGK